MRPLTRLGRYLGLGVMAFLCSVGCSHAPVSPFPLPAGVREQLGRIGMASRGPASLSVQAKPFRGAGAGAEAEVA